MSNLLNDTIMKKMMFTLIALLTMSAAANAMSYEQARNEALFLTDKMAYELNLTDAQYEAAYEINLDYLMSVTSVNDVYGVYWERRNLDLSYILYQWQWDAYLAANYFYRPLYWSAGHWHFGVYARYTTRDFFYFGRPDFFVTYRGGHAWHMNGGRSYYHGRIDQIRPALGNNRQHFGMRTRFDNGEFRHSGRSYGDNRGYRSGSSTRVTAGNNRRFGNSDNNDRRFGNSQGDNSNRRFGNSQSDGNRRFGNNSSQRQDLNSGSSNPSRNGVDVPSGGFGGNRSTNNRPSASSFNNNGSSRSNIEPSSNNRPSASSFNNNSNRSNIESSGSSRPNVSSFNNSNSNRSSNSIRPNIGSSSNSYSSGSSSRSNIGPSSSRSTIGSSSSRSTIGSSSSSRPNFGTSSSGSSSSNRSSSNRSSSSSSRSHFGGSRR